MGFVLNKENLLQMKAVDADRGEELFKIGGGAEYDLYLLRMIADKFMLTVTKNIIKDEASDGIKIQWIIDAIDVPQEWDGQRLELINNAKEALEAYRDLVSKEQVSKQKVVLFREPEVLFSKNRIHPALKG